MKTRWRSVSDERPLVVDPFLEGRLGKPRGPLDRVGPEPFDRVPHGAEAVGVPNLPQLHALGVSPVELGGHEVGDVDAVDDQPLDVAGHVDVDQGGVHDLDAGHVAVDEPGAGEVGDHEGRAAEGVVVAVVVVTGRPAVRTVLRCHRHSVVPGTDSVTGGPARGPRVSSPPSPRRAGRSAARRPSWCRARSAARTRRSSRRRAGPGSW